jgi:superfamily II DNA or RNA helicase
MILDNENKNLKVHEWIAKYNEDGVFDIVTGYFTIGALAFLAEKTNEKIEKYRFVLGDIVNFDEKVKAIDLLNESIDIDTAFKLSRLAKEAVGFLKLNKVATKTLEPNFCHAKLYLKTATHDDRNHYFVSGSSNLTDAGIGRKTTSNIELNIAETGNNGQFKELTHWFESLWQSPKAHLKKTLLDERGKPYQKDFKQYLIDEISKLFALYSPEQLYFKILHELFKENENPEVTKQLIKLEDTKIYNTLYDFQKSGVNSLLKMLNKYNGAILADAVGLGKTWSALAVMKSYQMLGHEVVLICPKKLEQNWTQYLKKQNSIFEEDRFDYEVRFHTDLRQGGMHSARVNEEFFTNDKPKLFVIDESHNLRNDKSSRYNYLVDEILKKSKGDIKVLLLSATPINNSFRDVRNQFKLIVKGNNAGFKESLDINNIEHTFREVQREFNKWGSQDGATLADFHQAIKESAFFRLTDNLLVARTRKNVKANFDKTLQFPTHKKPINIFKTPLKFGDVENFAELMENMKLNLSAYQPSYYAVSKEDRKEKEKLKKERKKKGEKGEKDAVLRDDVQREHFLVKMMMILMLKRLESSWYSFLVTVERIYAHHENALNKINDYQELKKDAAVIDNDDIYNDIKSEDEKGILDGFLFGKKNPVSLKTIDDAGNLETFKKAIKEDKKALRFIVDNVRDFAEKIKPEVNLQSADNKLDALLAIIAAKQQQTNKKIIIFSAYKDTVQYLFEALDKRGFSNFAMVSGDENKVWNEAQATKKHQEVLERFAPFTKLFKEKNWQNFDGKTYENWLEWLKNEPKTLQKIQNPIDILLATDVLSEGQNLQDADMVINYDIHWNPVRVIQRVGRIDRIGSPNAEIQSINFWPAKDIDDYINLKERVEKRMAIMKIAGSEVIDDFTDEFNELAEDERLEARQNANMLRQMETTLDEIDGEETLGFDDFSFDNYRQQLENMLAQKQKEFDDMPNGVFSGFKIDDDAVDDREMQDGIIALLGYPAKTKFSTQNTYLSHELIYIDLDGNQRSNNLKIILAQLNKHYLLPREVAIEIDKGDPETLKKLSNSLRKWIDNQAKTEITLADGTTKTVMASAGLDLINRLKNNPKAMLEQLKNEGTTSEKYNFNNFDLIAWLVVSK